MGKSRRHPPWVMKLSRAISTILLFLVSAALCAVFYLLTQNIPVTEPRSAPKAENSSLPDIVITGFEQSSVKNGITELTLKADTVSFFERKKRMLLEKVSATFFSNDGTSSNLVADRGIMNTRTNNINLYGNIAATSGVYKIMAQTLCYDAKNNIIHSDIPVVMTGDSLYCRGNSFTFYPSTGRAVLSGSVKAEISGRQ
ncbi:MAG: LPS export ABC transporter periplasmic protein LptC [Desulfococcus sp. 4484_241]|nr:MAG: LPS export ABC transporter periplasmic protein LptC [Desulfococcus sp. 4484_241]